MEGLPTDRATVLYGTGALIKDAGNPGNTLKVARINTLDRVLDNGLTSYVRGPNGSFFALADTTTGDIFGRQTFDNVDGNIAIPTITNYEYAVSDNGRFVGEFEFSGPRCPFPENTFGIDECNEDMTVCNIARMVDDQGNPLRT